MSNGNELDNSQMRLPRDTVISDVVSNIQSGYRHSVPKISGHETVENLFFPKIITSNIDSMNANGKKHHFSKVDLFHLDFKNSAIENNNDEESSISLNTSFQQAKNSQNCLPIHKRMDKSPIVIIDNSQHTILNPEGFSINYSKSQPKIFPQCSSQA